MKIVGTFLITVFAAFFLNLITLAVLGSFMGTNELQKLLGGTNSFSVFVAWWAFLATTTTTVWLYKKTRR